MGSRYTGKVSPEREIARSTCKFASAPKTVKKKKVPPRFKSYKQTHPLLQQSQRYHATSTQPFQQATRKDQSPRDARRPTKAKTKQAWDSEFHREKKEDENQARKNAWAAKEVAKETQKQLIKVHQKRLGDMRGLEWSIGACCRVCDNTWCVLGGKGHVQRASCVHTVVAQVI